MKKVFLIHCWEGHPEEGWYPWLKKELEEGGFEVAVPAMPDTNNPKFNEWFEHVKKTVGEPSENCYFVGHSLGCITILRYLESLGPEKRVGGVVLVAGFTSSLGYEEIGSFFAKRIEWEKIKSHCERFVSIHSDDDPYVSVHYGDFFKEKLGAKKIIEHNKKHFSANDGVTELPVVLEELLKM
jgi:predicted alpha/beta hydrolase family esterase